MLKTSLCVLSFLLLGACNKQQAAEQSVEKVAEKALEKAAKINAQPAVAAKPKAASEEGTFCFKKILNKDVTNVQLVLAGNDVTGVMNWVPYQKDSARGTLKGVKNSVGELDLIYDYMIEGNLQTESKIMKIDHEMLWVKKGLLIDPKNDGHLVYKDASQAKYQEGLQKADCDSLTE